MKILPLRILGISLVCFVGIAGSNLVAEENPKAATSEKSDQKAEPTPTGSAPIPQSAKEVSHASDHNSSGSAEESEDYSCLSGAALEDLRNERERLAAREKELAAKESELRTLEQGVREEFAKLEQARADVAKLDELKKKENEEKVAKIVETVESMSPKPAAALVASLDDALAVTAMQRISTPKLAKIMNVMEPGRSSRLTELLAGVTRTRSTGGSTSRNPASQGAAGSVVASAKGGENHDGQSQSNNNSGKKR